MNENKVRKAILEAIEKQARGRQSLQQISVLRDAAAQLSADRDEALQEAILTYWYDLFRSGHLAWGKNLMNPDPPWFHLTERGRETLKHLSRDPANPEGYMEYLRQSASLGPVAASYVDEALKTYASSCYKATAVMIGAAAERMVLDLRDALVARMVQLGKTTPRPLADWRIKTVFDAIARELETHRADMPVKLAEAFTAYWSGFVQQLRAARNDAGHPSSIDPVTPEAVHAALLMFPELASLASQLKDWVANNYA